jgi:hypothetical protein
MNASAPLSSICNFAKNTGVSMKRVDGDRDQGASKPQENEIEELGRGNVERLSKLQRLVCEVLAGLPDK